MSEQQPDVTWESLRAKRMTEDGAAEEYEATRLALETERAEGMTQRPDKETRKGRSLLSGANIECLGGNE